MLGHIDTAHKDVTIIGAGYSGLISAYRLLYKGYAVTIHEASEKSGGLISTSQTEYGPVEAAAHSIRSSPEILQLFSELDIPYVQAKSKKKYIFRDGELKKNPLTLWEIFTAGCYASLKKSEGKYLTLAEWTAQHIGSGAIDKAMAPLAHGIYAAEPEELDQQLAFPRMTIPAGQTFVERIFKGPKANGKPFIMAPYLGMSDLIYRLTEFVKNHEKGRIVYNDRLSSLPENKNIIVATPSSIAGQLIGSERLSRIKYAPMVSVTAFVNKNDICDLQGIGVLNARGEDYKILGILFNSATFEGRVSSADIVSPTIMLGGTSHPDILDKSDKEITALVTQELTRILGFRAGVVSAHITRWPKAIPLYSAELRETLEEIKNGWCAAPGHVLAGNYTGEVSIRGMCQSSLALAAL